MSQRLQNWVEENKTLLVWLLVGGVGFFGLLAGITMWRGTREKEALSLLLTLVDDAKKAFEDQKWDECILKYETLYKEAPHYPFFRVLALHGKGTCLRGKKEFLESAKVFERASLEPGHVDPLASRFEAIRSYQLGGDPKAEELYQALLKEERLSNDLKAKVEEELSWYKSQKKSS